MPSVFQSKGRRNWLIIYFILKLGCSSKQFHFSKRRIKTILYFRAFIVIFSRLDSIFNFFFCFIYVRYSRLMCVLDQNSKCNYLYNRDTDGRSNNSGNDMF